MKRISHYGNLPKPIQVFVKMEAYANMMAQGEKQIQDSRLGDFMPEIWEANNFDELKLIIKDETEMEYQVLTDFQNGRYYFTGIGPSGRIKIKGDWTVDETQVNAEQVVEHNGIVVFSELSLEEVRHILEGMGSTSEPSK